MLFFTGGLCSDFRAVVENESNVITGADCRLIQKRNPELQAEFRNRCVQFPQCYRSIVFLAKRDMDFVRMMSILLEYLIQCNDETA